MNWLISILTRLGLLKENLDYYVIRASMVIIFMFFGYQKWFEYEAQALIPYISHGPLIFWMYPVFGIKARVWFSVSQNGSLGLCCSLVSGTRNWESLELLAHVFHS
jgi:uncharacterized membrane protein YkgB